ncbi:AfsR/SARP family transcriptional regulator [Winogradskya humida]|uniref:SARP family transcriptional regulator n=1 Tax=Winogradskya humida TaxID=113566 RepID=A0ABQ4A623_9ACTN|nr:AfsR/SARP family transcriptional regulator [Actinoplanes humidus]GIE26295.1 SARP family transcriptional regulator [Actinoplanes humidus]
MTEVRLGILGPLVVTYGGVEVAITAGRDRTVLAMLILRAGRIVGVEELISAVWEDGPPATARAQLQTCVSRLRRVLPAGIIRTDPAGYAVVTAPEDLDAARFTRLTERARAEGNTPDEAAKLFREALALWRGPALVGLDARGVRRLAAVLDEQRAAAVEDWIDVQLAAGHERELVAELTGLVDSFPLRERLRAQLMLVLHRLGRRADALAEYARTVDLLREELGIEPGPALRDLHDRIVAGEVAPAPAVRPRFAPVRNLPRAVGDFTGRDATVERLVRAAAVTTVLTVDGMAGSGKTAVALQVAELLRGAYPDAQLFIDLRGFSEGEPLAPAAALLDLLRQLGIAAERIPPDLDGRAELWRSELADRRALVILDNAESSAHVARLLPSSSAGLVVVTSRHRLLGLDGGHPESLPMLDEPEAVALLGRIAGARVTAEPEAALEVVRHCGLLPLAIRLAGARLAHRPRWAVGDLAARLSGSALAELAAEDRTVAGAIALSYRRLPEPARRLFRLLGLHPAERFGAVSVAALGGLPLPEAQDLIDDLVDVHLMEEPDPHRYRLHELVRQYAAGLAETDGQALSQLLDLHLYATAQLTRATVDLPPAARPDLVARAVTEPDWLEEQRTSLAPLIRAGEPRAAWQLAHVSGSYLYHRGHPDELITVQTEGLAAAQRTGDRRAVTLISNHLAAALAGAGRLAEALERLDTGRAGILLELGRQQEAYAEVDRAFQDLLQQGESPGTAARASGLARVLNELGRHREALGYARSGLQDAVERRLTGPLGVCLSDVARARIELGDLEPAGLLLDAAGAVLRRSGFLVERIEVLRLLGLLEVRRGRATRGAVAYGAALDLAQELGWSVAVPLVANDLGVVLLAMGDHERAGEQHEHALSSAQHTGAQLQEGRAFDGLGACAAARGDPVAARRHWWHARGVFDRIGSSRRDEVDRRLGELDA